MTERADKAAGPKGGADDSDEPIRGTVTRVERDGAGRLVVYVAEREAPHVGAKVARCFPWSQADRYLCILNKDDREIVTFETLDELPEASRQVVREELHDKVFSPQIRRVVQYRHKFDVTSITADTDRGRVSFQIRSRDDVRLLGPGRALFRDVDGNTYEVSDLDSLDPASRKHLQQYF